MRFIKALLGRLRILWIVASIISSVWFLYWICYDVFVWTKPLTQAGPANYAGLITSIALAILGTQIEKLGVFEKLAIPPEQNVHKRVNQNKLEWERTQPIEQERQIQSSKEGEEATQTPPGASVPTGCKFYLGYLHTRPESAEIPEQCLECEHVVECMSPTANTINASA